MASTIRGMESYFANSNSYHHFWDNGTLFTTVDTSLIRNIWTTVFVGLNLSIGLLGAVFLKSLNLHRLKKHEKVPVNRLTSWISAKGALRYFYRTHQLPGGFYGLLMLATGVFGLAHQYFVNSFILRSADIQWECPFQNGVLTTHTNNSELLIIPASTFSAATTVYNAQYQVFVKDGICGIYEKVNYDSTTFAPTTGDVMGGWNCSYEQNTTIARADWQNDSYVINFVQSQEFFFTKAFAFAASYDTHDTAVNGFLAWSADQPDNSNLQWNVTASVATNLGGSSAPDDSAGTVTNLECQLVAENNWTLPSMPSDQSLKEWVQKTYGFLMTAEPQYYGFLIEWILNTMVMVTGSGNNDQWNASDLPEGASSTYGCSLQGTKIMPEIWIFLGALLLVVVPLVLADTFLFLLRLIQCWKVDHAHLVEAAPSSVEEWQLALIIEKTGDDSIKATDMRDYSYGWDDDEADDKQKCVISKNCKNRDVENRNSSSRVNPCSQSPVPKFPSKKFLSTSKTMKDNKYT